MAPSTLVYERIRSVLVIATSLAITASVLAEDFRIETKVFVGDEKQPASETTTLFLDGAVYDFIKKPEQTAVFRKPGGGKPGRFILLNDKHSVRTEISTEKLAGAMNDFRTWAGRQKNAYLQFAAKPDFDETFDSESGKLVLASHVETYTVTTSPADHPDALGEYKEFLDWYTQLNTLLSAGTIPPDPRLKLNASLVRHRVLPEKVELTRAGQDPLRAEHAFTWLLSQDDHKRIDNVRAALSTYKDVDSKEYRRLMAPTEATK